MRKSLLALSSALVFAGIVPAAPAAPRAAEVNVFVGGGTPLTNGAFFPGTQLYDGTSYTGQPLDVAKGSDLNLTMLDEATVANGHKLVSFKRNKRTQLPLFQSDLLKSPGEKSLVITSFLKPGLYRYYCSTHDGMFGAILIK
jgi:hypothetical protein